MKLNLKLALMIGALCLASCGSDSDPQEMLVIDMSTDDTGESDAGTDVADDSGSDAGDGTFETFAERPCPDDSTLTYDNFGEGFMLNWCTGCHHSDLRPDMRQNAPMNVDLNTVEDVRTHAERIWVRSGDQNLTMPPQGGPDDVEREELGEWLACGAP